MLNVFFSEVQVPPFTMRWLRLVINGDFFMAKEKKKKDHPLSLPAEVLP